MDNMKDKMSSRKRSVPPSVPRVSSVPAPVLSTAMEIDRSSSSQTFVQRHLHSAIDFGKKLDIQNFALLKCGKRERDYTDFYMLVSRGYQAPQPFKLFGTITKLATNLFLCVGSRVGHPRMDQYVAKLCLSTEHYNQACENFSAIKKLYEDHPTAVFDICRSAQYRRSREELRDRPIPFELYGLGRNEELHASKTVADPFGLPSSSPMAKFVPKEAEAQTSELEYPPRFRLRSIVPVFSSDGGIIELESDEMLNDKDGCVYFYVKQQAYKGKLNLKLEPIAVSVNLNTEDPPAKKARTASLI